MFQYCFDNVETSINIRRLNFHFQSNFNVETTLVHWLWIYVILSTLFQRCFVNVEKTWINVRRLNFHFQPNINVEKCWWTLTINVVSTLIQRWCVCWGVPVSELAGKFPKFTFHLIKSAAVTQTRTCRFSLISGGLCQSAILIFFLIFALQCNIVILRTLHRYGEY